MFWTNISYTSSDNRILIYKIYWFWIQEIIDLKIVYIKFDILNVLCDLG